MLDHIAAAVAAHRCRRSLSALPSLPPECPIHDAPPLEPRQPVVAVTLPCPTTQRRRWSGVPAAARAPNPVARPNPLPSLTAPPSRRPAVPGPARRLAVAAPRWVRARTPCPFWPPPEPRSFALTVRVPRHHPCPALHRPSRCADEPCPVLLRLAAEHAIHLDPLGFAGEPCRIIPRTRTQLLAPPSSPGDPAALPCALAAWTRCNTRFIKGHKPSNHIRARIKSHVYTTE